MLRESFIRVVYKIIFILNVGMSSANWDLDSLSYPVSTSSLLLWSGVMFVQLTNTAQYAEGMAGAVCIGLMGLRMFAFISQDQKKQIFHSLRRGDSVSTCKEIYF